MSQPAWGKWLAGGVVALLAGWLVPGCKEQYEPVPVAGKVHEDGPDPRPVAQAILSFHPMDESSRGAFYQTPTDFQGRFSLKCIQGRYKVTLALLPKPNEEKKGDKDKQKDPDIPKHGLKWPPSELNSDPDTMVFMNYRNHSTTPLMIEVPPGGKHDFSLAVKR